MMTPILIISFEKNMILRLINFVNGIKYIMSLFFDMNS